MGFRNDMTDQPDLNKAARATSRLDPYIHMASSEWSHACTNGDFPKFWYLFTDDDIIRARLFCVCRGKHPNDYLKRLLRALLPEIWDLNE